MTAPEALARLVPSALRSLLTPKLSPAVQPVPLGMILGLSHEEIGAIRLGPRYHYRPFTAAKPDGRERRLLAPSPPLKRLQRALLAGYLADLPVHEAATAFFPGASTVQNARVHAHGRLVAVVDLRDFFETTRGGRVLGFFARQGWRDEALGALMRLCVYRDGLPQGAPTSPCLSNLVNVKLDERLHALARRSRGLYTRYGDDLTFSWSRDDLPGGFTAEVEDVLGRAGYEVQPRKGWRVASARDRPVVTGVVLAGDGRLRVPWALRLCALGLRWRSWRSADPKLAARRRGLDGYVRMVERG